MSKKKSKMVKLLPQEKVLTKAPSFLEKLTIITNSHWGGVLLLLFFGILVFSPVFNANFFWDDRLGILESHRVILTEGLWKAWIPWTDVDYWPLTYNFFWILWRWGNGTPGIFHLAVLSTHIMSSIVIWKIAKKINWQWAWMVGLLFLIHPLNSETASWSLQLKTTLSTLLGFLSLFYWVCYLDDKTNPVKRSLSLYHLSLICFFLGLLAKTSIVTWPVVLALVTYWRNKKISYHDFKELLPFFVFSTVLGLIAVTHNDYHLLSPDEVIRNDHFWGRATTAGWALWFYIYKAFLPLEVNFMYARWNTTIFGGWLPSVTYLTLWIISFFNKNKNYFIFISLYFITLFPALGFVDIYFMKYAWVADHWQYQTLPVAILVQIYFIHKCYHYFSTKNLFVTRLYQMLIILGIIFCSWKSYQHSHLFQNAENVYLDTLEKNKDSWFSYNQLGNLASERKDHDIARDFYQKSIKIKPDNRLAYSNLGKDYLATHQVDMAIEHFEKALQINPLSSDGWADMCTALASKEEYAKAEQACTKSLEFDDRNLIALVNLGYIFRKLSRYQEALPIYEKAMLLQFNSKEAQAGLASTYFFLGKLKEVREMAINIFSFNPQLSKEILDGLSKINKP